MKFHSEGKELTMVTARLGIEDGVLCYLVEHDRWGYLITAYFNSYVRVPKIPIQAQILWEHREEGEWEIVFRKRYAPIIMSAQDSLAWLDFLAKGGEKK